MNTYWHFLHNVPRYVGEGCESRPYSMKRGSVYGRFLKKHSDSHVCVIVTSSHSDKVASVLQEQGFISWVGLRIEGNGTLMNVSRYGNLPSKLPEEIEKERVRKSSEASRGDRKRYEKVSRSLRLHKLKKFKKKHENIGKIVQSLYLRSKGVTTPYSRNSDYWGEKVLRLCLGDFPHSVFDRIKRGEDYGGKSEHVEEIFFVNCVEMLYERYSKALSKGLKGVKQTKTMVTCARCGKSGMLSNMKRYHFDNCKG